MPERPDYAALITGQTLVIEMINCGVAGLPALNRLLRHAQPALHAAGLAFVEYAPTSGQIVAATGTVEWARGWPIPKDEATVGCLSGGPRVRQLETDRIPGKLAIELGNRGLGQMIMSRAEIGGTVVGSLHALYHRLPDPGIEELQTVVAYLASCIAHLYGARHGLPTYEEQPTVVVSEGGYVDQHPKVTDQHQREHDRDLFVAVTSHELRTPVTVIKGYADTLNEHWDSLTENERRQIIRVVGQRTEELARLLDRLLASATEGGPMGAAPPARFDLGAALRTSVANLPAGLRHRVILDLPPDLPDALGDRASLATVLTELVTNADKYSPAGSRVEINAGADERTVAFRVCDRGIGIRPEHVERAFERFWQADSGDRRRYRGAGLGLYLVRKIMERQNGRVFLRPRPGGGTVAEVRLPRG